MASRFFPPQIGASTPGSSFSTPHVFNSYQFPGALFGSGWENSSSDVREPAQEVAWAYIDWRYEHEAKVLRELVMVESIESTPVQPFINSNISYPTHGHGFGYEQRNPFLGYPANASAVNSLPRQRQETGSFTGHENEVFSHYASCHNTNLRGIRVLRNMKLCSWSQANVEGNFPIMKLPEADVENKLTAASRPESEIPVNIPPLRHCPEGSHEGKMHCYGGVNSGNVQIFHRPQASITKKLPSDNHSVSEILIKANIHDQKEEKGWRKKNLTDVRAVKKPCEKTVEELSCSFSKVGSTSLCSVELQGKKHNSEGGSSIATKGIKKVKDATKKFKDGMKKVKNVKRVSKRSNHDRKFWCEMCNVEGKNETLMLIHRNGKKHLTMLRKNRGTVLVVSSNQNDKETIVRRR